VKKGGVATEQFCQTSDTHNKHPFEKYKKLKDVALTYIFVSDFQKMTKVLNKRQKLEKVSKRQNFCCYS
jgi:hypothetical protein